MDPKTCPFDGRMCNYHKCDGDKCLLQEMHNRDLDRLDEMDY